MKTFRVPIKYVMKDFSNVRDFWLTINDHGKSFDFYKLERKHEVIILFHDDHPLRNKFSEKSDIYAVYEEIASDSSFKGDVLYFDSLNGRFSASINTPFVWTFYQKEKNKATILEGQLVKEEMEPDDFFICYDEGMTDKKIHTTVSQILGIDYISYSHLNEVVNILEKNDMGIIPFLLFNYTTKESYQFSIKSTLNAVSLTIDMIKNKVLKYHYNKVWKIETVMHEALVNAITYGNELDYEKPVFIQYEVGPRGLRIWVQDIGEGFDVTSFTVPVGMEALEQISGRGIYIMKKFSESIFFNETGNQAMLFFDF